MKSSQARLQDTRTHIIRSSTPPSRSISDLSKDSVHTSAFVSYIKSIFCANATTPCKKIQKNILLLLFVPSAYILSRVGRTIDPLIAKQLRLVISLPLIYTYKQVLEEESFLRFCVRVVFWSALFWFGVRGSTRKIRCDYACVSVGIECVGFSATKNRRQTAFGRFSAFFEYSL